MPNKPTTLSKEEVSRPFEPKNKKLFEILKSLASTGNGDKYDPISAYKEIDRMLTAHNTELLQKIEGLLTEDFCRDCPHDHGNEMVRKCIEIINQYK